MNVFNELIGKLNTIKKIIKLGAMLKTEIYWLKYKEKKKILKKCSGTVEKY